MKKLLVTLPLQNESLKPIKVLLEPLSEYFVIQPGQKVQVHGVCEANTSNPNFTIAPNEYFLTLYAPGEISGFIDCYIIRDGLRLIPYGN